MKCPACEAAGLTSRFNEYRLDPVKNGEVERFSDEAGDKHVHDPALYRKLFSCTNGHSYKVEAVSRCPHRGCDWNQRPDVLAGSKKLGEG